MSSAMTLMPGKVSLAALASLYWNSGAAALHPDCRPGIDAAAAVIARAAKETTPVYGVNTGFGKLANTTIRAEDTEALQRNLILSHCSGVGAPLSDTVTRLVMSLKLISLGRGASGVRAR